MHLMRLVSVMVLSATLIGCQANTRQEEQAPVAPPASPDTLSSVRQMFPPNAIVGMVLSVRTDDKLAAVGDVPLDKFRNGQAVVFVDSNAKEIAIGTVVNITNGILVVRYDASAPGHRAPQAGDLMVRFQ